jgi:hypothetical protein
LWQDWQTEEEKMNRTQDFNERKTYVEIVLDAMLLAKRDYDFIKYAKSYGTESEYIRLGDLRGCTVTFNITGMSLENIMTMVCDYVVEGPTGTIAIDHIVVKNEELFNIAPLFKREVA